MLLSFLSCIAYVSFSAMPCLCNSLSSLPSLTSSLILSPFLILLQSYCPPRCSSGHAPPVPGFLHLPWPGIVFSLIPTGLILLPPTASCLCYDVLFFSVSSSLTLPYIELKIPPSPEHSLCHFFCVIFHSSLY